MQDGNLEVVLALSLPVILAQSLALKPGLVWTLLFPTRKRNGVFLISKMEFRRPSWCLSVAVRTQKILSVAVPGGTYM